MNNTLRRPLALLSLTTSRIAKATQKAQGLLGLLVASYVVGVIRTVQVECKRVFQSSCDFVSPLTEFCDL